MGTVTREGLLACLSKLGVKVEALGDDVPLFSSRQLDSVAMLEVLAYVEGRLGRRVPVGDVTLANFDTVGRILAWCAARSGGAR